MARLAAASLLKLWAVFPTPKHNVEKWESSVQSGSLPLWAEPKTGPRSRSGDLAERQTGTSVRGLHGPVPVRGCHGRRTEVILGGLLLMKSHPTCRTTELWGVTYCIHALLV